jgi:hypothetical protein
MMDHNSGAAYAQSCCSRRHSRRRTRCCAPWQRPDPGSTDTAAPPRLRPRCPALLRAPVRAAAAAPPRLRRRRRSLRRRFRAAGA